MKVCPECQSTYTEGAHHCIYDGATLVSEVDGPDPLLGCVLDGRFRLEGIIGRGGMGSVYQATQEPVGRPVAVKVLRPDLTGDKGAVQRFFHEARVVSKLRHPNTITLYDFGQAESGELYIAMEFLSGETLEQRMIDAPLELSELVEVLDQVCQSLAEAHEQGVIHRDLKPDNVFIDRVAGRNLVKVLDFGIAKVSDGPRLTQTGMVFGTPAFMSPEQAQGFKLDPRSDVYALGVTLYWLLSAQLPFKAESPMQLALKHVTERPEPIRSVSRYQPLPMSLAALVTDMLEKDPERRPQSVDEVRRRLRAVARELEEVKGGDVGNSSTSERVPTFKEPWSMDQGETEPNATPTDGELAVQTWSSTAKDPPALSGATRWMFAAAAVVLLIGLGALVLRGARKDEVTTAERGVSGGQAADGGAGGAAATGTGEVGEPVATGLGVGTGPDWAEGIAAAGAEVYDALREGLVAVTSTAVWVSAERARVEANARAGAAAAPRPLREERSSARLDEEARAAAARAREQRETLERETAEREAAERLAAERAAAEQAERERVEAEHRTEQQTGDTPRRGLMEPVLVP